MSVALIYLIIACILALAYIRFHEEVHDVTRWKDLLYCFSRKPDALPSTFEELLKAIADYRVSIEKLQEMERQYLYKDIDELEAVRATICEHRPFDFAKLQAVDFGKPVL